MCDIRNLSRARWRNCVCSALYVSARQRWNTCMTPETVSTEFFTPRTQEYNCTITKDRQRACVAYTGDTGVNLHWNACSVYLLRYFTMQPYPYQLGFPYYCSKRLYILFWLTLLPFLLHLSLSDIYDVHHEQMHFLVFRETLETLENECFYWTSRKKCKLFRP